MLAAMNSLVFLLYLFSKETTLISMWPQRILTFHSWLTFTAGVVMPVYLWRRWRQRVERAELADTRQANPYLTAGVVVGLAVFIVALQVPIMRLGPAIEVNFAEARRKLLATGLENAVLRVASFELRPFYLRCLPFLLFSDPALIERRLLLSTEWHTQPRHPTRVSTNGRPMYDVHFTRERGSLVEVRVVPSALASPDTK
jgi:hypothetical protein